MVDKKVTVTAELDASGVVKGAQQAEKAMSGAATSMQKSAKGVEDSAKRSGSAFSQMAQSARENERVWTTAGTALTAFGTVGVAAMAGSAKAAIDWESAWAGVLKTVDATPGELAELEQGLRDLSGVMPATHEEIAGVAEAAGQLGIQTPNILDFTETMVQMGTATNMSSEEAATALARFVNIMGTSQSEFDNIGAAVVGLGNNFATTESEIVEMGLRLAGAGRQAGLTEGEVLGLATALSSVGIEAQAGGTAFSRVLIEMGTAVDTGNEKLAVFAETAGMSTTQFATAFEEDAGAAIAAFVGGLGDIESAGGSIQPILEDLGMTDIRVGDALRRASSAADLFTGAMAMGNEEYAKNNALTDEAAKRYETVGAQLAIMRNEIVDAAISFGEVFLPAISGVAGAVGEVADALSSLPDPIKGTVGALGGMASAGALAAGGFMLVVPRAVETYDAFRRLQAVHPRAAGALGKVGKAAGLAAGGFIALQAAATLATDSIPDAVGIETLTSAVLDFTEAGDPTELDAIFESFRSGQGKVGDLASAADLLLNPDWKDNIQGLGDSIFGLEQEAAKSEETFKGLGQILATMVNGGDIDGAAEAFEHLYGMTDQSKVSADEFISLMPAYSEALKGVDNQARLAAEGTEVLAEGVADLNDQFVKVDPSILLGKLNEAADEVWGATRDILDAFVDLGADINNTDVSLDGYFDGLEAQIEARANFIDNIMFLRGKGVNEEFLKGLQEQGAEGSMRAQQMVDAIMGGDESYIERANEVGTAVADEAVAAATDQLASTDPVVIEAEVAVAANEAAERKAELESAFLRDGPVEVPVGADDTPARATIADYVLFALQHDPAIVKFDADGSLAEVSVENWNKMADLQVGMPKLDADPELARQQLADYMGDAADTTGVALLDANNQPALGATDAWWYDARDTTGTATLDAWNGPAFSALNSFLNAIPRSVSVSIRAVPIVGNLFGAMGGRAEGGWTGPGGKYDPVDYVHADEFVHTKENVNKPGMLQFHTDLWRTNDLDGAYTRHKLRGYADGGPVGMSAASPASSANVRVDIDYDRLAQSMSRVQLRTEAVVTPSNAARIVNVGAHANSKYGG